MGHPGTNPNATDFALKEQQMLLGTETSFQPCDFAFFDLVTFRRSFHTLKQEEVHVILHFQATEKEILVLQTCGESGFGTKTRNYTELFFPFHFSTF